MKKITIMGLGYIGLPTAITFALAGYEVCGFDINAEVVGILQQGRIHIVEPGLQEALEQALKLGRLSFSTTVPEGDAFIITVQTPYRETPDGKRVSDISYVESAATMLAPKVRKGNLVVLESTVPPTTTRRVEEIVESISGVSRDDFYTAHCPERVLPGRMLIELRENNRIIGARVEKAGLVTQELYSKLVTKGQILLTDDITAEMCKLVENTYRDINIAYANELSIVADRLGIDVYKLISLANCHPRVNILTPGVGVGGHCIAVDPWFIHEKFEDITPLIYAARTENDNKPAWVAQRVARDVQPGAHVCVLGLSYKPDIDDMRESPSVELCHLLKEQGFHVTACEPHVKQDTVHGFENLSLSDALQKADYLVITLQHTLFKENRQLIAAKKNYDCVGLLADAGK